jgi:hypothetical protein
MSSLKGRQVNDAYIITAADDTNVTAKLLNPCLKVKRSPFQP